MPAKKRQPKKIKLSNRLLVPFIFVILFGALGVAYLFRSSALTPQGTYTNWFWNAPAEGFSSLKHSLTVDNVTPDAPYFWSHQFQFLGGDGGYIGLQSRGNRVDGTVGKTAIFSIFSSGIEGTPGACSVEQAGFDGYNTSGTSCRIAYEWQSGRTYTLRTEKLNTESNGIWWAGYVKDETSGIETKIAQIKVPTTWKGHGGWSVMWTEYFGTQPSSCDLLPYSKVRFGSPTANNGTIASASSSNNLTSTADCKTSSISPGGTAGSWVHQMGNSSFNYPDATAPVVAISQPAAGTSTTSPVQISGSSTDNKGVVSMEILVNGSVIKTASGGSISASWTAPTVKGNGNNKSKTHTITIRAKDAAGNVGSKSTSITVR